ncbi:EPIDERMAL PATTERNING FACTOR-like protein 2 [Zingiber officinale]|uniref:EPIDERMAL PATTERNING FACTOR-like protein 2 n=1 Tax=Zingiber officinale TaxID=94328 RepID=UPI001C4C64F1|nr:EPIDERMAL PATTERNING FACTOR-like protein 2 [Zingiber officinale]
MSLFCHSILSLFLLFASVHSVRRTQGRALLEPREVAKGQGEEGGGSVAAASCADCVMDGVFDQGQGEEGGGSVAAAMIGSRPPRCEGRCLSCGQCEAIQVPAIPQDLTPVAVSSRGDEGSSIYKPLSWKCKCGGMILNP